ncbi:MAG: hypothetical protein ACLPTZ_02570 [Beijerinckiaceae bacterium]
MICLKAAGGARLTCEVIVERFVGRQNIEHYRAMIKNATDLERRGVFKRLLRDEEAKLKKYEEDHKKNLSINQN